MTISQLRRRVNALKRRFAPELAIIKLRRIAEAVANDWDSSRSRPPEPGDVIGRIADDGFRLSTFANLRPLPRRHPTPGRRPRPLRNDRESAPLGLAGPLPRTAPLGPTGPAR